MGARARARPSVRRVSAERRTSIGGSLSGHQTVSRPRFPLGQGAPGWFPPPATTTVDLSVLTGVLGNEDKGMETVREALRDLRDSPALLTGLAGSGGRNDRQIQLSLARP